MNLISCEYFVNCNKNVCYKNNKSNKNVYWKDLDNSMYNLNKINYEGYPPSFINPLNKNNNYFDFKNLMMKVDYLLNDNTNCRSNNRIQGRVGQRVHLESHSMKAHVMRGRVDNKPLSVRKAYCLGLNTHPHIHTFKQINIITNSCLFTPQDILCLNTFFWKNFLSSEKKNKNRSRYF